MGEMLNTQMQPIQKQVADVAARLRSFYSNGSGGPPGALEIWREEDNKRFETLFATAEESKELAITVKDFIKDELKRREARKQRIASAIAASKVLLPIIGSALLAVAGFLYHAAAPVVKVLWEEYLKAHPSVSQRLNTVSQFDPQTARAQDAGLPSSYVAK